MKRKSTMCFCYKTVVCNSCSGDDNVHEPICTKTIFYCKSHTHRHKHQDLVKKKHWLTIGRSDPDLSSHLQTLSLHSNTYTHTNAHWCNLTNSENAEQGTGHGETGTLWTKPNRQTCLHFHFEFSGKFLTSKILKHHLHWKLFIFWSKMDSNLKAKKKKQSCWYHTKSC